MEDDDDDEDDEDIVPGFNLSALSPGIWWGMLGFALQGALVDEIWFSFLFCRDDILQIERDRRGVVSR